VTTLEVKFGYQLPPYNVELIKWAAQYADSSGYSYVFMADHLVGIGIRRFDFLEAWSTLGALSAITERVKLGTCVSDPHRRHPAVLAQSLATLDQLTGGRAILGLGAGEAMNLEPYGIEWSKPVSRLREAALVVRRLLTEDRVSFTGRFYRLRDAMLEPKGVQKPNPPIWIAANSPRSIRIAAELGDGWVPTTPPASPERYRSWLSELREHASRAGRSPSEVEPALFLYSLVAPTREEAWEAIRVPAKLIIALWPGAAKEAGAEIPESLGIHRFTFTTENVEKLLKVALEKIPDEAVDRYFIYGSPSDCIEKIGEYAKAGVRSFIVALLVRLKDMKAQLKLYTERVVKPVLGGVV